MSRILTCDYCQLVIEGPTVAISITNLTRNSPFTHLDLHPACYENRYRPTIEQRGTS
jgi:hypothetical protein